MPQYLLQPQRYIQQYQTGIPSIGEQNEQDDKNDGDTYRNHLRQTFRGPLLILEIPGPFQTVPFGQTDGGIHLLLCFGHGRSHIPATHRELHGTKRA